MEFFPSPEHLPSFEDGQLTTYEIFVERGGFGCQLGQADDRLEVRYGGRDGIRVVGGVVGHECSWGRPAVEGTVTGGGIGKPMLADPPAGLGRSQRRLPEGQPGNAIPRVGVIRIGML